ncbi:hypothetical protein [Amycolatopsis sp. lyj-112]|uniref:hypothetical protein n=1 Tax=Amycolatopsis sp. lyj-112 TaxID=2789288 RepID=UPI00397DCFA6
MDLLREAKRIAETYGFDLAKMTISDLKRYQAFEKAAQELVDSLEIEDDTE